MALRRPWVAQGSGRRNIILKKEKTPSQFQPEITVYKLPPFLHLIQMTWLARH